MDSELQDSSGGYEYTEGSSSYPGEQQPLRSRRVSSPDSNQNYPQFNWNPEEDEEGDSGPPRELRSIPLPMSLKRAVRQVQQMKVPVVSRSESWKRKKTRSLRKLQDNSKQVLYVFALWKKTLQKIGGNFGSGVQSYFIFLRFLVVLNFVSFFLIAGFVLAPSIVFRYVGSSLDNSTGPAECMEYNPNPNGTVFYQYFLDLLSGTGFMEYSYLFYGYYNNAVVENKDVTYNIPLAYILTAMFYFAFCLICIIARMGANARVAVATGGRTMGNYSMIVFTGWDYSCLRDRDTKLKQKNIHYRLQVDLEEERLKKQAAALTLCRKVVLYSLRTFLHLVAFGLIIGAFFGIFWAADFSQVNHVRAMRRCSGCLVQLIRDMSALISSKQKNTAEQGILGLFYEYLPSIVITTGNFLVPMLCDQIALIENYSPSTTVIVALLRAVFLRLVSLGVLLFTLWGQITCNGNIEDADCKLCQYNYKVYQCWETRIGQEMYKLTLFDLLINIAVLFLVEFPRRIVVDKLSCKLAQWVGRQEFVVPSNVLGLVYGQAVVWTGTLFCPLLPLINTIKFIILFYCKKITLFHNCRPAHRTFRSTTSTFFFLVVLLFGWGLATVVMVYSLAEIRPSLSCGPFRFFPNMWSVVPTSFYNLSETTQEFLFFIGSQSFSIPLFALSCVVMCYFIALASVYGKSVALLKTKLKLEGRDKQFLVKQIEQLGRQLHIPIHNAGVQD